MRANREGWLALTAVPLVLLALLSGGPWLAVLAGVLMAGAFLWAWHVRGATAITSALGGALVLWAASALMPMVVRWGNGLALMGLLLVAGMFSLLEGEVQRGNRAFRRLALATALLAYVSAQATWFNQSGIALSWLPRAEGLAAGALGLLLFTLMRLVLARQHQPWVRRLALASSLDYVLYLTLLLSPSWAGRAANPTLLLGSIALLWLLLVGLAAATIWLPNKATVQERRPRGPLPAWRIKLNDYLTLMKVRVASLLLATTLGAMIIAAQGWPGWALVGWVMLGGLLSVGGSGALNHYLDRDIDGDMGRTSLRPLPSGRIAPVEALAFGLLLSVLQFAVFWFKVNPLAAALSTGGLLYYVLIYTIWLKRRSSQNIVIGGAAGAFPPLVGWAAVTGDLSLGALYLFAIIFYWTPPHFWALALMRKEDYARAKVPMLPVVRGDKETRLQILLYTLLMIALTLIVVPLQLMGLIYLVAALVLNAKFLFDALRLYRQPSNQSALALYKYSLLYLALLFAAMALDRALV